MRQNQIPLFKVFQPKGVAAALQETLYSGFLAEGPKCEEFRTRVSKFIHNPQTVLMNSCTTAITIAYRICGVGPGTEVVTTPLTCIASNTPILDLYAKPVWADVDPKTGMSTAETISPKITPKTKAILVLHKEGDLARMDEILALAKKHNLKVVEDSAHAFGAKYEGKSVGTIGDFACFSFQAIKHITTGDGGALSCKSPEDFARASKLKWFGVDRSEKDPWHAEVTEQGYKGNMNDIAATIGIEQIKEAEWVISRFNENGEYFKKHLSGIPGTSAIQRSEKDFSTYWGFCLLVENRSGFIKKLKEKAIEARQIHPRNDGYAMFKESCCSLPGVDYFDSREVCIPTGWWVTPEDREQIVKTIKEGW